jgi:hypothetical protein
MLENTYVVKGGFFKKKRRGTTLGLKEFLIVFFPFCGKNFFLSHSLLYKKTNLLFKKYTSFPISKVKDIE